MFSLLTGAEGSNYGWYGMLAGASIVFFAFIGFDIVATTAEETKNPQRDVARGILASLAIVTVLYVAVAVVLSGMVSYTELRDARAATPTWRRPSPPTGWTGPRRSFRSARWPG